MKPAEAYIIKQEEPYKSILLHLQLLIEHSSVETQMKFKWAFPCYYQQGRPICYLRQAYDYVDVGFWHSNHVEDYKEHLVSEKRKEVRSLRYRTLDAIDDVVFISILKAVASYDHKSFLKYRWWENEIEIEIENEVEFEIETGFQ